jgi:hypothetical protein
LGAPFPFDLFEQMALGNWIAWATFGLALGLMAIHVFLLIVKMKMPQLAWNAITNEMFGSKNPTIAECYESNKVKFHHPQMLPNGFTYDKSTGAVGIPLKQWSGALTELDPDGRELLNKTYTIENSNVPFYLNYSMQAVLNNPMFLAIMEHEQVMDNLRNAKYQVGIPKATFLEAVNRIDGDFVNLKAMNLTVPIDIKKIKTVIPKALGKSNFKEFENHIRNDERKNGGKMVNWAVIGILLNVVTLIAVVALHFLG